MSALIVVKRENGLNLFLINMSEAKKISDKEIAKIKMSKEDFHGEWNYSVELEVGKI